MHGISELLDRVLDSIVENPENDPFENVLNYQLLKTDLRLETPILLPDKPLATVLQVVWSWQLLQIEVIGRIVGTPSRSKAHSKPRLFNAWIRKVVKGDFFPSRCNL